MTRQFIRTASRSDEFISAPSLVQALNGRVFSVGALVRCHRSAGMALLAALTPSPGTFSIRLPSVSARSLSIRGFVFAAVLLFGCTSATVIVALDSLVLTSWLRQPSRSALPSCSIWPRHAGDIGGGSTFSTGWFRLSQARFQHRSSLLVLSVLLLAVVYFVN